MKRIERILRATCLMLLLPLALSIQAQNQFWVEGIHYEIYGNATVKVIASNNGSYSGRITIPQTVMVEVYGMYESGYKMPFQVIGIGENAFRDCTGLTSIELPNSIKTIEDNAFYGCSALSRVNIPNYVTKIGASAFAYCTSLTDVVLPNSITTLGANVFYSCSALTSVMLPGNVETLTGTFHSCTSLTTVDVPVNVKKLDGTFNGCTALSEVKLPNSLTHIMDNTFDGCAALQQIYLPNKVSNIGVRAFAGTGLTSLELPASVTTLSQDAFNGCTRLESVTVRNTRVPYMDNRDVFSAETYTTAALHVPVASITSYQTAQWWCDFTNIIAELALNTPYDFEVDGIYYLITGPNTVDVTYRDTYYNSYSGSVTVPATVTHDGVTYNVTGVGNAAFYSSKTMTSVSLPSSITSIGAHAFYGCNGLTSFSIPEAVKTIGDYAFGNCTGLAQLTIPENVTTLGDKALMGIPLRSLVWNARECWTNGGIESAGLNEISIGDEVTVLPNHLAYRSNITSVQLPTSLKIIGDYTFNQCKLTSLTVPVNVTDIGTDAFGGNSITSLIWNARECWTNGCGVYYYTNHAFSGINELTIGDEVEVLPGNFVSNSNISSLTIPASVKHIGNFAFRECMDLTAVVIPDNVITIGESAFEGCSSVSSLVIGKNVTSIGDGAFVELSSELDYTWNARHCECAGMNGEFYNVRRLTIGNEVEILPRYFCSWANITSLELPSSLQEIKEGNFSGCQLLTNLFIPNSVTAIGDDAFAHCSALTSVVIPRSVISIGWNAFAYCKKLTDVVIPASVTSIGENAFNGCTGLTGIASLATTPPTINSSTFGSSYNKATLRVPAAAVEAYRTANYWSLFMNIEGIPGVGPGDLNGDGRLSISDITTMIDALLSGNEDVLNNPYADVNGDGVVNINDITALISMILAGSTGA